MPTNRDILTARLKLRPLETKNFDGLKVLLSDPTMTLHRESDFDDAELMALIADSKEASDRGDTCLRLLLSSEGGRIIGLGGIKKGEVDGQSIYEAYMYLASQERGKGYGREALSALVTEAVKSGIDTIHSYIGLENYPMQLLLEYIGFIKDKVETVNLDYNIVTRAHFTFHPTGDEEVRQAEDFFFFPRG